MTDKQELLKDFNKEYTPERIKELEASRREAGLDYSEENPTMRIRPAHLAAHTIDETQHPQDPVDTVKAMGPAVASLADPDGKTVLMYLGSEKLTGRREAAIDKLMEFGADIDAKADNGDTALIISSREIDQWGTSAGKLIQLGANKDAQNKAGDTALIAGARVGNYGPVEVLAKAGAALDIQNNQGNSALMETFKSWKIKEYPFKTATILIDAGANVNLVNADGDTALILSARRGDMPEITRKIAERGADIHAENNKGENVLTVTLNTLIEDIKKPASQSHESMITTSAMKLLFGGVKLNDASVQILQENADILPLLHKAYELHKKYVPQDKENSETAKLENIFAQENIGQPNAKPAQPVNTLDM